MQKSFYVRFKFFLSCAKTLLEILAGKLLEGVSIEAHSAHWCNFLGADLINSNPDLLI